MSSSKHKPGEWLPDWPANSQCLDLPEWAGWLGVGSLRVASYPDPDVSVSELSALIFAQYRFAVGTKQLSGFSIASHVVIFLGNQSALGDAVTLKSAWGIDGQPIRESSLRYLAPEDWLSLDWKTIRAKTTLESRATSEKQRVQPELLESLVQQAKPDCDTVLVARIPFLEGKIEFRHQEEITEGKFGLWLPEFRANPSRIQPYFCPLTGQSGKQLTIDHEGDIGLVDSLKTCAQSGAELFSYKMVHCANTATWAPRSRMIPTAVGGQWMITDAATCCRKCGLPTAKVQWDRKKQCPGCQALQASDSWQDAFEPRPEVAWCRDLLDTVVPAWNTGKLKAVVCESLTWIQLRSPGQGNQLLVLDGAGQLIVHRRMTSRWRNRWEDL